MSNIYNISQHIKEIITPLMKEMGFKKQNFHFVRINGKYKEDIWIQKSQGNFSGEMNQFYINYYVYKDIESKIWNAEFRLPNKPVSECPKRYIDYYKDFSRTFRSTFSKNEENEIHSYLHQQLWTYSSEDELVKILNILALLLNDYQELFHFLLFPNIHLYL